MSDSLDCMIGQMIMIGFRGTVVDENDPIIREIHEHNLGGVWLTDNDSPMGDTIGNVRSPQQVKELIDDLQAHAEQPLFVAIDAEGGQVIRLKEQYGFPKTLSARMLGRLNDIKRTEAQAETIARLLKALGVNFNFAPVLDLNKVPENPALGKKERTFSDDADVVLLHARKVIESHKRHGLATCVKHFPGHGSVSIDSHDDLVDLSLSWTREELRPFSELIHDNMVEAILPGHVHLKTYDPHYPATLSNRIIGHMLRKELGFKGLVISDDLDMGAIRKHYPYKKAVELAINAGVDIILRSNVLIYDEAITRKTVALIKQLVKDGRISEKRIEESFNRIQRLKADLKRRLATEHH